MAGTLVGTTNMYGYESSSTLQAQLLFVSLYNAFEHLASVGKCNRISLYYGDGASGMDYADGVNPVGYFAFALYRFPTSALRSNTFDVLIQWGVGTPTTGNGFPVYVPSSSLAWIGAAFTTALDSSGNDATAWGGTTANDGTDAKSNPVWTTPAGGSVQVYPRSNNTGGITTGYKDGLLNVFSGSYSVNPGRMHLLADDDNLVFLTADIDDQADIRVCFFGPIVKLANSDNSAPFACILTSNSNYSTVEFGTTSGTEAVNGGVYTSSVSPAQVLGLRMDVRDLDDLAYSSPNRNYSPPRFVEYPLAVYSYSTSSHVGYITEFLLYTSGLTLFTLLDGKNRLALGAQAHNTIHFTVPWDGASDPNAVDVSREGSHF